MAAVAKRDAIRPYAVKGGRVGVNIGGAGFQHLIGASVLGYTAGAASVEQVITFDATGAVSGAAPINSVTVDISAVQPHMPVMVDLQAARKANTPVEFRWDIYSKELLKAADTAAKGGVAITAEIDTDTLKGALATFAGTDAGYSEADINGRLKRSTS